MDYKVDVVYAFTKDGEGGNAAGVMLEAAALKAEVMQAIAAKAGFSETVFFCRPDPETQADHRVRFFTPLREVPLCGHGTIAGYAHLLQTSAAAPGVYLMQTLAGLQTIRATEEGLVAMTQNLPSFGEILDPETIAPFLGLDVSEMASDIPIQIVSTGLNKILAPIKSLQAIKKIQPDLEGIKALSGEHEVTGIYTFTLESEQGATAHCRNFAPAVGISEDAATGTSCAALSCLLFKYGQVNAAQAIALRFEQGYEIGEPSEIMASLKTSGELIQQVEVLGRATMRRQLVISL